MKEITKKILRIFPPFHPRNDSLFPNYVRAHQEELEVVEKELEDVLDSKQIDNATGEELDEIGKMYGVLGERGGRSDSEYRTYLKSLVQSFKGRGTVPGIRFAVSAGLTVPESDVEILEDFQNVEYTVRLHNWTSHQGSTVEEMAQLSDASAASLKRTEYRVDPDISSSSDSISIDTDLEASDTMHGADTINTLTESAGSGQWGGDNWEFSEWR